MIFICVPTIAKQQRVHFKLGSENVSLTAALDDLISDSPLSTDSLANKRRSVKAKIFEVFYFIGCEFNSLARVPTTSCDPDIRPTRLFESAALLVPLNLLILHVQLLGMSIPTVILYSHQCYYLTSIEHSPSF